MLLDRPLVRACIPDMILAMQGVLQNALPELLAGNVPSIAAALAATPSLSPLLIQTQPMPAMAPSAVNGTVAIPPAMVRFYMINQDPMEQDPRIVI